MNLFELLAAMAAAIRNIDGRITYAPLSLAHDGHAQLLMLVNSDDAVRDLATRFELAEPRIHRLNKADGSSVTWLAAGADNGSLEIRINGPHTQHAPHGALTSREGA